MTKPACTAWATLQRELDGWQQAGLTATFWWRDDDAVAATPQLDRLAALSCDTQIPLAIAAIPAALETSLPEFLAEKQHLSVLQHGYAHSSFAAPGVKKIEIGGVRDTAEIELQLAAGRKVLAEAFATQFVPVLVPPWNRIESRTYTAIENAGLRGVSSMWARAVENPSPNLLQVNTHLDPVNWRFGAGFVGEYRALGQILRHLHARRQNISDCDEPTGILTHHLVQDDSVWQFCRNLMEFLNNHPAVSWVDARSIWSEEQISL